MIASARESEVQAAEVRLRVDELGDPAAPTVLLMHGYPDTKEVWADVARLLASRFHVVAYDVRGAGASTAPRDRAGYDLERLAADAAAVIDAVAPGRTAHVVGHDWGSITAWELATSPELSTRVRSLTSISGPSLDHAGAWMWQRLRRPTPRGLAALAGQARRSWYIAAFQLPVLPELAWRTVLGRRWPHLLRRLERLPADGAHPAPTLPQDAARGVALYRRNMTPRLRRPRRDATVDIPVQLIVPCRDRFLSPRLYDDLDRWAPVLWRRSVDSGHWLPRERPRLLAGWIADFVGEVEAGSVAVAPPEPTGRLTGRLALVTGAGGGIGRATAFALAGAGARVLAVDVDAAAAERTAELARLCGGRAWAIQADVSDAAAMERLDAAVAAEHGVVDILVNNAGIGVAGPFLDTTVDEWRRLLDVNLWGVLHGCRLFGRRMVDAARGGQIVNVASAAAFGPSRLLPAYSTSKAAVLMLSECLRAELAPHGIGVTAVCPGLVDTGITRATRFAGTDDAEQERLRERAVRLYRRRNFPPERVASEILRAVERNPAVLPVTVEAHVLRLLGRLAPGVVRTLARRDDLVR